MGEEPKKKRVAIAKKTTTNSNKKPPKTSDKVEEEPMWHIGKSHFVKVHDFWGNTYVDIRCYYYANGDRKPSKTGVSLNMTQWKKFMESLKEVNEAVEAKREKGNLS